MIMHKKELYGRVAAALRENDIKKPIRAQEGHFTILDDSGKKMDFVVKQGRKNVGYTADDVEHIVDACVAVIIDAIKHGETVTYHGFGKLGVHYRAERKLRCVVDGEWVKAEGHYVPKFDAGIDLKNAARVFEQLRKDTNNPFYVGFDDPDENDAADESGGDQ